MVSFLSGSVALRFFQELSGLFLQAVWLASASSRDLGLPESDFEQSLLLIFSFKESRLINLVHFRDFLMLFRMCLLCSLMELFYSVSSPSKSSCFVSPCKHHCLKSPAVSLQFYILCLKKVPLKMEGFHLRGNCSTLLIQLFCLLQCLPIPEDFFISFTHLCHESYMAKSLRFARAGILMKIPQGSTGRLRKSEIMTPHISGPDKNILYCSYH